MPAFPYCIKLTSHCSGNPPCCDWSLLYGLLRQLRTFTLNSLWSDFFGSCGLLLWTVFGRNFTAVADFYFTVFGWTFTAVADFYFTVFDQTLTAVADFYFEHSLWSNFFYIDFGRTFIAQSLVGLLLCGLLLHSLVVLNTHSLVRLSLCGLLLHSLWSDFYCTVFGRTFTAQSLVGLLLCGLLLHNLWSHC